MLPEVKTCCACRVRLQPAITQGTGKSSNCLTGSVAARGNLKILTSCPSCLQGLSRYEGDLQNGLLEADYIVVEMARQILGETWLQDYVGRANAGGIERVLV
mgnify:CR=1 FL=1